MSTFNFVHGHMPYSKGFIMETLSNDYFSLRQYVDEYVPMKFAAKIAFSISLVSFFTPSFRVDDFVENIIYLNIN